MEKLLYIDRISICRPTYCVVRTDTGKIWYFSENEFSVGKLPDLPIIGFDLKEHQRLNRSLRDKNDLYDLRVMLETNDMLHNIVCKSEANILLDDASRLHTAEETARHCSITTSVIDPRKVCPSWMLERYVIGRMKSCLGIFQDIKLDHARNFKDRRLARTLLAIEDAALPFYRPDINQVRGKTGRLRIRGGFNCMGIKKDEEHRRPIKSRWDEGLITSIDFNAIDFRCIIRSVDDREVQRIYEGCDDFHQRTMEFLVGSFSSKHFRDIVKFTTYAHAYGSSMENIIEKFPDDEEFVRHLIQRFSESLRCIGDLRNRLYGQSMVDGFVVTPTGRRVKIEADDHPGKVMGLYAQSYSSDIFEEALCSAVEFLKLHGSKSKVIFPIHDEMVIDEHPDEGQLINQLISDLEDKFQGHRLKIKTGKDYYEASK